MAVAALLPHAALVGLFGLMAGKAGRIGLLEFGIQMAGFTSGDTVDTDQRKTGDVVLEKKFNVPSLFIMAITTILTQLILMHIDGPMTCDAIGLLKVVHRHCAMAGGTDQILMFALEWKLGVIPMIELHLGPALSVMAILALLAVSAFVHIIFFMA